MSEHKHTPEPWDVKGNQIKCPMGHVAECFRLDKYIEGNTEANAERIVTCVNAMAGIDDPAAFVKQAKAAPEMLKSLEAIAEGCSFPDNDVERAIRDRCRAAIAKAEGEL